jgi:hypothetical protein
MNPQTFSVVGYVSVGAALLVPVLWLWHWRSRPRRWLCHWAVVLAVVALALAKYNSATHVSRIEVDKSEQIARARDAMEEDRKRKEAERADDVADVRFVEDSSADFLDQAGMNAADAAYYMKRQAGAEDPAWKQEKQSRVVSEDGSLEGAIGARKETDGVAATGLEDDGQDPIVMQADEVALANRLDKLNLGLARSTIWLALGIVLVDYLRRFHRYEDAYFPLPLPDAWFRGGAQYPVVTTRPREPRRGMAEELAVLIRQGATFLWMTDDATLAEGVPSVLYRLPFKQMPVEVLPVNFEGKPISTDFVFQELWFGRTAFWETDPVRTNMLLAGFCALLAERRTSGAHARQPMVIVWHRTEGVPKVFMENVRILGPETGVRLFVCNEETVETGGGCHGVDM